MDTGEGRFREATPEEVDEAKALEPVRGEKLHFFSVGEQFEIRGSLFKVVKITPKKLTLRVLPRIK